jgi:hypothetical protein
MEKEFDFKNHQVGDKVYHIVHGWVKIEKKVGDFFYVKAQSYNYDGKYREDNENPTIYPHNPFEQTEERMVEVYSDDGECWEKRILIKEIKNSKVLCWAKGEDKTDAYVWDKWREIQPKKELTTEEKINILWEKHNNDFLKLAKSV